MDIETLRWHLSENKYIENGVLAKLKDRIDIIIENNIIVKERLDADKNNR